MKKILLSAFALIASCYMVKAQTGNFGANYTYQINSGSYTPLPAPTVLSSGATIDDAVFTLTLSTPFNAFGAPYTNLYVSENGFVGIGGTTTSGTVYTPLSTALTNSMVIAGFGRDLAGNDATSQVSYLESGSGIVIEWKNLRRYTGGTSGFDALNFQVFLNYATGQVGVVYGAMTTGTAVTTAAQVGIRGNATTWTSNVNNLTITSTAGNCSWANALTGSANNSSMYFNAANTAVSPAVGLTYMWTPGTLTPPVRTIAAVSAISTTSATLNFTQPAGTPTGYNVQYRAANSCAWTNAPGNPYAAAATIGLTGLTAGTAYEYRIQSVFAAGNAIYSHVPTNFTTTASCAAPSTATVSGITTASANFAWTSGGTAFDVYYGATPLTAPTATTAPTASTSATTFTATGLSAGTAYAFYVRNNCGAGVYSAWTAVTNFATPCNATNIPYTQDFESVTVPAMPLCTSVENPGTGNIWVTSSPAGISGFNTKTLTYNYSTPSAANTWFYTQGLNLTMGVSYRLTYNYANRSTYPENLRVNYGSAAAFGAMTMTLTNHNAITSATLQTATVDFVPSSTGVYYIGFNAYSIADQWQLFVDDIHVDLTPTCTLTPLAGTITGPTAVNIGDVNSYTITPTTGNIQWYSASSPTAALVSVPGATAAISNYTANMAGTVYLTAIASSPGCVNDTANVALAINVNFPGDDVCAAIPLSIGTSAPYYLAGATTQTGEVVPPGSQCGTNTGWCNSTLNNTMWFSFVAPASGYVSVHTLGLDGTTGFDSQLAIWKAASCNDLLSASTATLMAANDDDALYSVHGNYQNNSYCQAACLTPGATYFIQLDSYVAATASFSTSVIITDLGALNTSFTGLSSNYCIPAASSSLTPATTGGIFTVNTSTTGVTSFNPSTAGVGTHTVTYSIYGCQSMSTTIVANTPTVNASASSTVICAGETVTLTATGATNYTWSPVGGMSATAVVSPTANASYTVLGEDNGCMAGATVNVDVNAAPTLSLSSSTPSICVGSNATLLAQGATNYTWAPTGDMTPSAVVSPTANATYTVTGETAGCSATGTISLDVYDVPVVMVSPMSTTICAGTSVTLTASGADSYAWSNGDMTAISVVTPTANATYTVVGTNACGSATVTPMVDVTSSAVVNATTSSSLICTGQSATLTATGATNYTWSPGGELTASIVVSPTATATYTVEGSSTCGTATTTITQDVSLCTGINNLAINSNVSVFPNPNTGSVNITITTELKGNISLQVYDAIGKLVMTENLTNDSNTINTSKLEAGIYIYKIINNNQEVKVGKMIKH